MSLEQVNDIFKDTRFKHGILEGLLYLSSEGGAKPLPSEWEHITSEIVGAVYEYITGEEFKDVYSKYRGPYGEGWVDIVNKHLEILDSQNKFNPALADAFRYLLRLSWKRDYGESWWEGQIRFWFLFGFRQGMHSTFALTVPEAIIFKKELGEHDPDTRRHLENIAEIMKKYIQKDLEYIRERYRW